MMQANPLDSKKMISTADRRWDEQDQYQADKYKDRLLQIEKILELHGDDQRLDGFHAGLLQMCKKQLQRLREQEFLDSLQRKWETGEGLKRLVMKALEDVGKEQGFENLPREEIERLFKVEIELNIKDGLERQMCTRWADYFQHSLGVQGLQALLHDLPEFRRQIDRLRRQSLQDWQHELEILCIERAYLSSENELHKFSGNPVRVQAQGCDSNMEENVRNTLGSVGCAGDKSSALFAVPTSVHQQFRLNNLGDEGSDVPGSNQAPTIASSTDANRVLLLVDQLTANQSKDERNLYGSPNVDNQLEAKHKPIQMMSPDFNNFGDTSEGNKKSVVPKSIVGTILTSVFLVLSIVFGGTVFGAKPESESPKPVTIHKLNLVEWIRTSGKRSYSGPLNTSTNKKTCNPRPGEKGFVLHSAGAKGNRVRKNIFVISSADNGTSSSEGAASTLTGNNNLHRETDSAYNDMPEVILDNQAHVHCTGNFNVLSNLTMGRENIVLVAANNGIMDTFMSGSVHEENFELTDVHYCPDLGNRIIVSGSILDNDGYGYAFGGGKFTVKDLKNDTTVGEGRLVGQNYILDYLKIPRDRTRVLQPGLVTTVWNSVCSALHRLGLKY